MGEREAATARKREVQDRIALTRQKVSGASDALNEIPAMYWDEGLEVAALNLLEASSAFDQAAVRVFGSWEVAKAQAVLKAWEGKL